MDSLKWEHLASVSVPAKPSGLWTLVVPYVPDKSVVKIIASGTWKYAAAAAACGPDGVRTPAGALTQAASLDPASLVGSLVGKVGGGSADKAGTVFGVGSQGVFSVAAGKSGAVFLSINDEVGGMDDNDGNLTVQVFVSTPPPPPAADEE